MKKRSNIHVNGMSEEERNNGTQQYLKKFWLGSFPKMTKAIKPQILKPGEGKAESKPFRYIQTA